MHCHFCHKEINAADKIGRQDRCPECGNDLHICYHCAFYDVTAYNECREPQADRVVEKDRSNFCDYFSPSMGSATAKKLDPVEEAKKKLEAMFKK